MTSKDYFHIDYCENTIKHSFCHFHEYYEIDYFETGERTYTIDDKCFFPGSNAVFLIKPYSQHSTSGNSKVTRMVFYFSQSFLYKYFTPAVVSKLLEVFNSSCVHLNKTLLKIHSFAKQIITYYKSNNLEMCALVIAQFLLTIQEEDLMTKDDSSTIISKVVSYIYINVGQIYTVDDVASHFFFSTSYLSSIFKNSMNIPIKHFIIVSRVNYACKELISTNYTISEIADHSGFSSSTHFSNTFKKYMQTTPQAYRALNRG